MSLMLNSNSDDETLYSDSVFSTTLYTGNGSTQTINNGIDLAGKGGMVWIKNRTTGPGSHHAVYDTNRLISGIAQRNLNTEETVGEQNLTGSTIQFLNTGWKFDGTSNTNTATNLSGNTYVNWTFRKAAKFFDVVTYTGNGGVQNIAHSLGIAPGMIFVKCTNAASNWQVYSRGLESAAYSIQLNLTNLQASAPFVWNSTAPTSSVFTVGADNTTNGSGRTYVAYLFAHETSSTGIIQCGGFTDTAGSLVNLGWEPQFVLVKLKGATGPWMIYDSMRGMTVNATLNTQQLTANTANAEVNATGYIEPTSTGFKAHGLSASESMIYMAIRRPNKPPTSGTQVYNAIVRTGTGAAATVTGVGFAPDLVASDVRTPSGFGGIFVNKLSGGNNGLRPQFPNLEVSGSDLVTQFNNTGYVLGADTSSGRLNASGNTYVNWLFKRAPGFFDEVCYTGTGSLSQLVNHNLTVAPELIIYKCRSAVQQWVVACSAIGLTKQGYLDSTDAFFINYDLTATNSTVLAVGAANASTQTYVAYLFATLAGISKVGSYTGNGSSQNIDCGFAAGARFVLIKRTDNTGDWFVWDTVRGIVAANDPHLSLNTTAAEVTTDDSIDPYSPGFTVNQVAATNINVTSATYIFLAIS